MIVLSEFTNKLGSFNKQISIDVDGKVEIDSAANVVSASAKTVNIEIEDVATYIDGLKKRYDTALVLGVWRDGLEDWDEYDIETMHSDKIDPAKGVVARTKDFFEYANNDRTSLVLLDFDGDHTDEVRDYFLKDLDVLLQDALIGELGHERNTICRWSRPSSSASASIDGKTGNGLHIYMAVKNGQEELIKLIHRFCWLQPYGQGYKITKAATILPESLVDPAVGSPERVVYSADITVKDKAGIYEYVDRKCDYTPGGVLDCELALEILREFTADYDSKWRAFKRQIENSTEVKDARTAWREEQIAKRVASGTDKRTAKKSVKQLANGILMSDEMLLRNDGSYVQVKDILLDPDEWIGVGKFCDPIKQELGRNVGMILGNEERPFLNSKSHGGVKFYFKWNYEDLEEWLKVSDEDEIEDNLASHVSNAVLNSIQEGKIIKAAAKKLDVAMPAIKSDIKEKAEESVSEARIEAATGEEEETTFLDDSASQGDVINDYIRRCGDCKGYGDGVFVWKDGGTIWKKHSASFIQKKLPQYYNHVGLCRTVPHYKNLSVAIINDHDIKVNEWKQEYGIPCSDGFYKCTEIGGVEKVEYTKELGCRFKIGMKPDWQMKTPLFDKVIANVDNQVLYQQLCGLTVSGYLHRLQQVFVMFGEGGAGKGTTNDIMTAMLPRKQVTSIPLDKLNEEKYLLGLTDSRVNFVSETSDVKRIDLTGLKKASGGDQMVAWVLYQGQKSFTPTCSFVLNMNNWIKLAQVGEEIRRRVGHTIVKFTKEQSVPIQALSEKIIENELPGVLAWCIEGCRLYFEHGLIDDTSGAHYQEWIASVDPITLFLDERVVFEPRSSVLRSDLWNCFVAYCEESKYFTGTKGKFLERMDAIKTIEVVRMSAGYVFNGCRIRL
jgi:hypothetical protein